jgi:hypothetical protein
MLAVSQGLVLKGFEPCPPSCAVIHLMEVLAVLLKINL